MSDTVRMEHTFQAPAQEVFGWSRRSGGEPREWTRSQRRCTNSSDA